VEPKPRPAKSKESEQRFEREQSVAEIAPQPQTTVVDDRLRRQLAALQNVEKARPLQVASVSPTASAWSRTQPAVPTTVRSDQPAVELRRESTGSAPAIELKRQAPASNLSKLAEIPDRVLAPKATAPETSELAQRSLAGNSLVGPAADRPLESYELPHYPDWAKREGVEASVSLYFLVSSDGRVKENILVQKTSGFEDFDREARRALLVWRFEPLPPDLRGDQWGTITFNFRLKDMR
jgi:TonB family protein